MAVYRNRVARQFLLANLVRRLVSGVQVMNTRSLTVGAVLSLVYAAQALLCATQGFTEDAAFEPLPPETTRAFNRSVEEAVNAITLFTSQNSISAGAFKLDGQDGYNSEFTVTRLPLSYMYGEAGDTFRPIVRGVVGVYNSANTSPTGVFVNETNDFSRLYAWSFNGGIGLQSELASGLTLTPYFDLAYSHLKRKYDFNNSLSQTFLINYDRDVFNTSLDVLTYAPSLQLAYEMKCSTTDLKISTKYVHLFNDSFASKSSIINVSSDSGELQTTVEATHPLGASVYGMDLAVHPFVVRSDVYGDARKGVGLSYFHEYGVDLLFDVSRHTSIVKSLSFGSSYTSGESLHGWRLGLGVGM